MDIKTEVYALETANSSVQSVDMTAAKMKTIAKKYMTMDEDATGANGVKYTEGTVADNDDAVTLTIEYPDHVKVTDATITYDPTPTSGARVQLSGGESTASN